MATWIKTFRGNAVNLDMCSQLIIKNDCDNSYFVKAFFPGYDGNGEPCLNIQEYNSEEEAQRFIDSIVMNKSFKSQSEELAEILR